jgi:hypothetical protein
MLVYRDLSDWRCAMEYNILRSVLSNCTQLRKLRVDVFGDVLAGVFRGLQCPAMQVLDLSCCDLDGDSTSTILAACPHLSKLRIGHESKVYSSYGNALLRAVAAHCRELTAFKILVYCWTWELDFVEQEIDTGMEAVTQHNPGLLHIHPENVAGNSHPLPESTGSTAVL